MKKITMSIHQFMEMERNNTTLKNIIRENKQETFFDKVINNEEFQVYCCVAGLGAVLAITPTLAITTYALSNVGIPASTLSTQPIGGPIDYTRLLSIIRNCAYGTCFIGLFSELKPIIVSKKFKEIPAEVLKYALAFGTVYFAGDFFKLIRDTIPEINVSNFNLIMEQVAYSNNINTLQLI